MRLSLTAVTSICLPVSAARLTHDHLRAVGARGLEGIALWVGRQDNAAFQIHEALVPEQKGIRSDQGVAVMVAAAELQRINLHLYRTGQRLLAQIHSHPARAYHSDMDDAYPIATALGAFSLVVPDFALGPFSIARFATYRLTPSQQWEPRGRPRWQPVDARRAADMFKLVD